MSLPLYRFVRTLAPNNVEFPFLLEKWPLKLEQSRVDQSWREFENRISFKPIGIRYYLLVALEFLSKNIVE